MAMTWDRLLSNEKLRPEPQDPDDRYFSNFPINPFELDYNRIVTSAAFRRLQDKTQVFPLAQGDFVRTRLTHSIEVSTVAYQLGQMLTENVQNAKKTERARNELKQHPNIASVLRCAGLIHDLGNPPFGHFGEEAIGSWFRENLDKVDFEGETLRSVLESYRRPGEADDANSAGRQMIADLEHFEGNAQALRLLCMAQHSGDINVSYAVISALVKYPTTSLEFDGKSRDIRLHKPGVHRAEEEAFRKVSEAVGTLRQGADCCRHPLTYLMEAADDIAYSTADLEDAYRKKFFTLEQFTGFFARMLEEKKQADGEDYSFTGEMLRRLQKCADGAAFSQWLYAVRRWLMYVVVWKFFDRYDDIMAGTYESDLFCDTYHECTLEILKAAMVRFVYSGEELVPTELSGQTILYSLLDGFVRAVLYWDPDLDEGGRKPAGAKREHSPSKTDRKYLSLLSSAFKENYRQSRTGDRACDLYLRLLMVTDHISGMTDTYARDLFRHLRGME